MVERRKGNSGKGGPLGQRSANKKVPAKDGTGGEKPRLIESRVVMEQKGGEFLPGNFRDENRLRGEREKEAKTMPHKDTKNATFSPRVAFLRQSELPSASEERRRIVSQGEGPMTIKPKGIYKASQFEKLQIGL